LTRPAGAGPRQSIAAHKLLQRKRRSCQQADIEGGADTHGRLDGALESGVANRKIPVAATVRDLALQSGFDGVTRRALELGVRNRGALLGLRGSRGLAREGELRRGTVGQVMVVVPLLANGNVNVPVPSAFGMGVQPVMVGDPGVAAFPLKCVHTPLVAFGFEPADAAPGNKTVTASMGIASAETTVSA